MASVKSEKKRPFSIRLLVVLSAITLGLLVLHFGLQYLNWVVFGQQQGQIYELANRFDVDDEVSVPTWYSQILLLFIGLAAFAAAYLSEKKAVARLWAVFGTIGVVYSIDEGSGLHEFVLQTLHVTFFEDASSTKSDNAWLIILPFVLLIAGWLVWSMIRYLPKRTMLLFVLAGFVFLTGAVGIDLLTSVTERESFLHQGILAGLEEALEIFGSIIALYAIVDYIEKIHATQVKAIVTTIKNSRPSHRL